MIEKFKTLADYNIDIHHSKGIGRWRMLYKSFLDQLNFNSIIEVGAGPPLFLNEIKCSRRIAIDGGDRWKKEYSKRNTFEMGFNIITFNNKIIM